MSKKLIPPGLTYLANNIDLNDNIIGAAKKDGAKWAKDVKFSSNTETVFFAGCGYQYSSELETLMSLIRSIDKSPVNTEMTMNLAIFQRKLGLDMGGGRQLCVYLLFGQGGVGPGIPPGRDRRKDALLLHAPRRSGTYT